MNLPVNSLNIENFNFRYILFRKAEHIVFAEGEYITESDMSFGHDIPLYDISLMRYVDNVNVYVENPMDFP